MTNYALDCPSCHTPLIVFAADIHHEDPLICVVCRALSVFCEADEVSQVSFDGEVRRDTVTPAHLRRPTDLEEMALLRTPRVQQMIRTVADYHRRHGSPSPTTNPPDGGTSSGPGPQNPPY